MRLFRLLAELKRRHVYQVAAAYAVASFAVLEAADLVLPALLAPTWIYRALVILVLAGFPVVVTLAWIFDITPDGVRRDEGPAADGAGAADAPAASDPSGTVASPIRLPRGRPLLVGTLAVGLVGVAAWVAGRETAGPPSFDPDASLAVMPFAPAVPDTSLERVGRELVVTVSSALAATADVATAEPLAVLATVPPGSPPTLEDARKAALSLGAKELIHGGLVRVGGGIRLEVGLYETEGLRRLGNQAITAETVGALTDSATLAALRLIWKETPTAPPSPGAVSTGSLTALQAYLAGERAAAEGRWREAPEYFARAVAADSSFWYAYWRLQYSLQYYGSPVDSVVRARVWQHRHQLPDRDRLLIEARAVPSGERIPLLREATTRFPTYWPAWWDLAEAYVHHGGYLGYTRTESRAALERTLALNPRFVVAWSHLFWIASAERDTTTMRRVIDELSDAHYDRVSLEEAGINSIPYYQAQLDIAESDHGVPRHVVETGVSELSAYRGPGDPESLTGLAGSGYLAAQIELVRELRRRHTASPAMERAQQMIMAHSLAGRGGWDAALAAADSFAASATEPDDLLIPYQLAVTGAWSGAVSVSEARRRRPGSAILLEDRPELQAETAWLDGVLAFANSDAGALGRARTELAGSGGQWTELLDGSLAALARGLAGDSATAGRTLAELELNAAREDRQDRTGLNHPFLNGIDRLTAARWLLAAGDTVTARRLLPWHEVVTPAWLYRLRLANQVLAAPALRLRWALAEAAGREREAARYERLYRERWGPEAVEAEEEASPAG